MIGDLCTIVFSQFSPLVKRRVGSDITVLKVPGLADAFGPNSNPVEEISVVEPTQEDAHPRF